MHGVVHRHHIISSPSFLEEWGAQQLLLDTGRIPTAFRPSVFTARTWRRASRSSLGFVAAVLEARPGRGGRVELRKRERRLVWYCGVVAPDFNGCFYASGCQYTEHAPAVVGIVELIGTIKNIEKKGGGLYGLCNIIISSHDSPQLFISSSLHLSTSDPSWLLEQSVARGR